MRSHIIGVAGPSSSGKSELAKQLVQRLPGTSIVSLDSYYRGMEEIPLEERKKVNFDHPDSLDWELLHEHLVAIAAGRAFDEPVYSFADYARTAETRRIEPSRVPDRRGPVRALLAGTARHAGHQGVRADRSRGLLSAPPDARRGRARTHARRASASSTSAPSAPARNGSSTRPKSTPTWWSPAKSRSNTRWDRRSPSVACQPAALTSTA